MVVTGGAGQLGSAFGNALAAAGAKVALLDRVPGRARVPLRSFALTVDAWRREKSCAVLDRVENE
jgi:NAD(P)-dependent dehydrogenase (short-subunit alcohol dehydrogenase family)